MALHVSVPVSIKTSHRKRVRSAVDCLHEVVLDVLPTVALPLLRGTSDLLVIDLVNGEAKLGLTDLAEDALRMPLQERFESLLAAQDLERGLVTQARLELSLRVEPLTLRCPTTLGFLHQRRFDVFRLQGKSILRTPYVHMWHHWAWQDRDPRLDEDRGAVVHAVEARAAAPRPVAADFLLTASGIVSLGGDAVEDTRALNEG